MATILVERTHFPRDKVCGDCLNPAAWPVLDRLGVADQVRGLVHSRLGVVDFVGCDDRMVSCALPETMFPEIAVRRRDLDQVLLRRAEACGAEIEEGTAVTGVSARKGSDEQWKIQTAHGTIRARSLVAGDGRNSTVLRLLGHFPRTERDRAGLQTHIPLPDGMTGRVRMRFRPEGYCGLADIGGDVGNLCLVARSAGLDRLRTWAQQEFGLEAAQTWRAITPLSRAPIGPRVGSSLLLVGDAARVVEPFTGEGIYYALASGELAARALVSRRLDRYPREHAALYKGRLWINRVAKAACLYPGAATVLLRIAQRRPELLGLLTKKVTGGVPGCHYG